jgi:hypothetical protein
MRFELKNLNLPVGHAFGVALALGATASTCSPARADDPNIAGPTSFVRVLHAVAYGPKVDVYIDGQKKLNDVEFGAISKYLRVRAGYHTFRIMTNNPARTILSSARTLRRGDFYTLSAWGNGRRPRLLAFNDSGGSVAYNRARLTAFHLAPGLAPVDVIATTQTGRTYRLFRGLRYGQIRASYVPAVPMTIRFTRGGRTIKTITGVEPRAGRKYAAYAMGVPGQTFRVNLDVTGSQ